MRLMHTRLPDFYQKVIDAGKKARPETEVTIEGLENFRSGKLASLRVGRVENEIAEITQDPDVVKVEVFVIPRNTETDHSVIIRGIHKDGTCPKAIMECMYISSPGEDCYIEDVETVDDRRYQMVTRQ